MLEIFYGDLYYDDSEGKLAFDRFIVRDNEIGFSATETSVHGYGPFGLSGTAKLTSQNTYKAHQLKAQYGKLEAEHLIDIEFTIVSRESNYLTVRAIVETVERKSECEGDLELK